MLTGKATQYLATSALLVLAIGVNAEIERLTVNDGNLVMEDVPEIPGQIVEDLNRYQHIRSARFSGWTPDETGIYVVTRFGDVRQLHRVDMPEAVAVN